MKRVGKYNLFKSLSLILTAGTPLTTMLVCGEAFLQTPAASVSTTGVIVIIVTLLLLKDKLAENWKVPSAFIVSTVILIVILLVENILQPAKIVCIATMIATGLDEVTFKRFYTTLKLQMPKEAEAFTHFGLIFCKSDTLEGVTHES